MWDGIDAAERSTLIGSRWVRRVPEGDSWDRATLRGLFDLGERGGGVELVLGTTEFSEHPVLTADVESFVGAYKREGDDDPAESLRDRIRELEGRLTCSA